jgi:hypothetical protein
VVRDIERHGGLDLGSKEVNIAVIFSDIENFSSYSEKLWTQKIFTLMSMYLSKMTEILQSHGATLDKYIGMAISTSKSQWRTYEEMTSDSYRRYHPSTDPISCWYFLWSCYCREYWIRRPCELYSYGWYGESRITTGSNQQILWHLSLYCW